MTWCRWIFIGLICLLIAGGGIELLHRRTKEHSAEAIERRAGLDSRIAKLDWENLSSQAAAEKLGHVSGTHIEIVGPCLEYVPYLPNHPRVTIHAHLHDVKLSTALDILCSAIPTGTAAEETYEVQPDGTIALLPDSSIKRINRIYDVHDLLDDPNAWPRPYQPLEKLLLWNINAQPATTLRIAGKWVVFATRHEHAQINSVLRALRSPSADLEASDQTAEALGHMVGPIRVHQEPVAKVIDALAEQAGVNLVVNWTSLASVSRIADPNSPTSADFERLPLRAALNQLLERPAVFAASDNVLLATYQMRAIAFRETRAYELADLICLFAGRLKDDDARRAGHEPKTTPEYYAATATSLLEDVTKFALPHAYRDGLGYMLGTRLLLAAPSDVHWELRRIFAALRQFIKDSAGHPPAKPRLLSGGEDVFARLNTTIGEISLNEASLTSALATLQSLAGVTIGFDRLFSNFDKLPTRPITLHLWNIPLSVALHEVLKAASNGAPLCYGIDQGIIVVSTFPDMCRTTRIYDVSDLAREPVTNLDQLAKLISQTINAAGPSEPAGYVKIDRVGNWLIVMQSPQNHLRIESLLNALRNPQNSDVRALWPDDSRSMQAD